MNDARSLTLTRAASGDPSPALSALRAGPRFLRNNKKLFLIIFSLSLSSAAYAQAPGTAGFRTKEQERQEFIAKLKRDIAKVAHSVEVTKELIGRSRGAPFLPDIYLRLAELYVEQARYEFYVVHEERGENAKGSAVVPTARLLKEKAVETYERILSE